MDLKRSIKVTTVIEVFCQKEEAESIQAALKAQHGSNLERVDDPVVSTTGRYVGMKFISSSIKEWGCICGANGMRVCTCSNGFSSYLSARKEALDMKVALLREKDPCLDAEQNQMYALLKQGTRKEQAKENRITQWFKKHFCR